jgi:hypothetical protein
LARQKRLREHVRYRRLIIVGRTDWGLAMPLDRIEDRLEIQAVLYRYARGVDRRDWQLVRSTYHPDAYDDHGTYKGDVDGFMKSLIKRHETIEQSLHVLANCIIEFASADRALVETYMSTYQRLSPAAGTARLAYLRGGTVGDDEAVESTVFGRFVDLFTRRNSEWRVARRTMIIEVYRGMEAAAGGGLSPNWTKAKRDGNDPVEQARRELGLLADR